MRTLELNLEQHQEDTTLTRQECLDIMATAKSVEDWNALREIVKSDYECSYRGMLEWFITPELTNLLAEIDSTGLIVKTLDKEISLKTPLEIEDDEWIGIDSNL